MRDRPLFAPADEAEACAVIAEHRAAGKRLTIGGAGSKAAVGQPVTADATLSSQAMTGIVDYHPAEMVIIARAGTPLTEIEAALAENGQMLAFGTPDWGPLLASDAEQTIGGVAATNLSGSRRFAVGAARDALLGVRFVNGRGEVIKSGGRVMKNVTGLDLVKLLAGSWGTLGLITEVAFKVTPSPQTETTLVVESAETDAAGLMAAAMRASTDVTGAAHLPAPIARSVLGSGPAVMLRLEGFAESVAERAGRLKSLLGGSMSELDENASRAAWTAIGDVAPFADGSENPVWRLSAAPMAGHRIVADIRARADCDAYYDWQGGLIWLRMSDPEPGAQIVRGALAAHGGGHATLMRASRHSRARTPVFQPESAPIAALSRRIAASIDPDGVFNCGRRVFGQFPDAA